MKKIYNLILTGFLAATLFSTAIFGQTQKLAQTGMKFLSVANDARASGMGDAVTSLLGNSESMFFNPAGMARITNMVTVSIGQTNWIAGIKHIYGSAAFAPFNADYGVIGVFVQSVDYGDLNGTIIAENPQGFLRTVTFSPTALAVGLGYAKALTDKFSIGGNVKYVTQDLGETLVELTPGSASIFQNKANIVAFDFGILYHTGYESLTFGMSIRNFSQEIKFSEEAFELPLTFKVSISMNAFDLLQMDKNMHSLVVAVDAVQPRDYYQQVNVGLEYTFLNTISLRGGISTPNDEHSYSAGVGVKQDFAGVSLAANYAYTPFTVFQDVHRITLNFGF